MARNPLTAVPATRSSLPLLRIRRRLVLVALTAAVVSGVFSTFAWVASGNNVTPATVLPNQRAIALAQTVVGDYLAGRPSTVPAAANVNNDFSQNFDPGTTTHTPMSVESISYTGSSAYVLGDSTQTTDAVLESFTAQVDLNGVNTMYEITVPMVASGGSWVLGAEPSLAPAKLRGGGGAAIDYSSLYSNDQLPNQNYTDQIDKWATTYAKAGHADPALYTLTGDRGPRTYSGLGGWRVVTAPEIKAVVQVKKPILGYIVTVALVLHSPAANGPNLSTTYDLYLEGDLPTSQPPVLAWGPAGSYRVLTQYMNADQH